MEHERCRRLECYVAAPNQTPLMALTRSQLIFSSADHRQDDDDCAGFITALDAAEACKVSDAFCCCA